MSSSIRLFQLGSLAWRSLQRIDEDLDDEFDFHLECRTREFVEAGMTPEVAAAKAQELFGRRDRIHRECMRIGVAPLRALMTMLLSVIVICLSVICWMGFRLQLAQREAASLQALLAAVPAEKEERHDLAGEVVDADRKPISNARVVLIYKHWPDGRYAQQSFVQRTDQHGRFNFEKLYSTKTQTAFLVTILADAHVMESQYLLCKAGERPKSFEFRLKRAIPKIVKITDGKQRPLANVEVWPSSRKPKDGGEDALIYDQSRQDAGFKTDAAGKVSLPFFSEGDSVELHLAIGKNVQSRQFVVDRTAEQEVGQNDPGAVVGMVRDASQQPIADAKVLLAYKSWPNNRFQMETFHTVSSADGSFRFPVELQRRWREAFHVTVVKDGFAFESQYVLKNGSDDLKSFEFQLNPAAKKTLELHRNGKPLANVPVAIASRKSGQSEPHVVYAASAAEVTSKTNAMGQVELNDFATDDEVELTVSDHGESQAITFRVDQNPVQTIRLDP